MHRRMSTIAMLVAAMFALPVTSAHAEKFHATLSGFDEIGALNAETGAILTPGTGSLKLDVNRAAQTVTFQLTYSGLSAPVTQSHIHFGKVHVAGGVIVFFCTNLNNGPTGTQACPPNGGTVSGTIIAADVIGPPAQHVSPGDFDALADALASDTAYVNVHSTNFPAGEIRGQIRRDEGDDD